MPYTITLYAVALLTIVVLGAAALVILMRLVADRRRARAERSREAMATTIAEYRVGECPLGSVVDVLRTHPGRALDALVDASSRLTHAQRATLLPLYEPLGLVAQEIEALSDRHWPRRMTAASRLGTIGDREAVLALVATLDDPLLDVRLAAAHALARLEAAEAVEPILRSLALPGELPSRLAADALLEMGDPAIASLVAFLRRSRDDTDPACMSVAIQVLGQRKSPSAVPCLIDLLDHASAELRLNAARALGQIGDAHALTPLCRSAQDPIWGVRSAAAQALGRIGDARALPTLSGRLIDRAWWVRYNAAQALYRLGSEGRDALLDTVARTADRYARDISMQVLQQNEGQAAPAEART